MIRKARQRAGKVGDALFIHTGRIVLREVQGCVCGCCGDQLTEWECEKSPTGYSCGLILVEWQRQEFMVVLCRSCFENPREAHAAFVRHHMNAQNLKITEATPEEQRVYDQITRSSPSDHAH